MMLEEVIEGFQPACTHQPGDMRVLGLIDAELARDLDLGVLVPTTLVVLGGGLVLGAALSGRRPPERDRDGPAARG